MGRQVQLDVFSRSKPESLREPGESELHALLKSSMTPRSLGVVVFHGVFAFPQCFLKCLNSAEFHAPRAIGTEAVFSARIRPVVEQIGLASSAALLMPGLKDGRTSTRYDHDGCHALNHPFASRWPVKIRPERLTY